MSLRATLRRSWPVLVSYGVFSVWGTGCLVASLVLTKGGLGVSAGDLLALGGVLLATAVGHVAGNLLGLVGLRLAPVVALFTLLFLGAMLSGLALGPFALYAIIATFSALGGYLGVASRLDVVAAWYPLSFCVGGAIVWMNQHEALGKWESGAKHAVWDPFTILCLTGGVFLMLVFLATRNALSLTVWQEVARRRGPEGEPRVAVARPGRGSLVVLFVFTVVVLGATALLSPYLFRTGASDGDGSGQSDATTQQGDGNGGGGSGSGQHGKKKGRGGKAGGGGGEPGEPLGGSDAEGAADAAGEALEHGMRLLAWLLAAVVALLLLMLLVFPPIRRALLLRHLERPLWPVAPTARVMNLWRRALAALAVADIEPSAGEMPRDFARRAEAELSSTLHVDAPGLNEAAAMVEKIDYAGRGLSAGDEQAMRQAVEAFIGAITPRVALKKRLAAAWGRPPEVES